MWIFLIFVSKFEIQRNMKPIFIAGPCVIESTELLDIIARELVRIKKKLDSVFRKLCF